MGDSGQRSEGQKADRNAAGEDQDGKFLPGRTALAPGVQMTCVMVRHVCLHSARVQSLCLKQIKDGRLILQRKLQGGMLKQ